MQVRRAFRAAFSPIGVCGSVVLVYGRLWLLRPRLSALGMRRYLSWGFVLPLSDGATNLNNALRPQEHGRIGSKRPAERLGGVGQDRVPTEIFARKQRSTVFSKKLEEMTI